MRSFTFNKEEDNRWYIELPEWEGSHAELEMVAGFDKLLDYHSPNGKNCVINVMEEYDDYYAGAIELTKKEEVGGGAVYSVEGCNSVNEVWLCHVTKFVFNGRLPEKLYLDPYTDFYLRLK